MEKLLRRVVDGLLTSGFAPAVTAKGTKCYVTGTARSPVGVLLGSHWHPELEGRGVYSLPVQDALGAEQGESLSRAALDLLADLEECFTWYATGHRELPTLLDDFRIMTAARGLDFPPITCEVSHAVAVAVTRS